MSVLDLVISNILAERSVKLKTKESILFVEMKTVLRLLTFDDGGYGMRM